MNDIINLRRVRKAKARAAAEEKAAENRERYGIKKAERGLASAKNDLERRRLEAHRRVREPEPGDA